MNRNDNVYGDVKLPLIGGDVNLINNNVEVFKNIIGQDDARKQLQFYIENSSEDGCFPNLFFSGSQGLGKSFMARKVSGALGRELIEVNCSTLKTVEDFVEGVLINRVHGETPKTIFLDEAHSLSQKVTDILLSLLEPINNKSYLCYKPCIYLECDFQKINFILASTDPHLIFRPLLSRFSGCEIYFHLYTNNDLYKILCSYLPSITITCDKEDIAYAARGRAREIVGISKKIAMYCNGRKTNVFDNKGWQYLKETFSIHPYGLKNQEIELMKVLKETFPLSASNIAIRMGENVANIENVLEVRPRELGLIESGTRGRMLTNKGLDYLKKL